MKTKSPLVVAFCYLWVGFVCAISFVETPLILEIPGVNSALGLEISRLVMEAMNKMEWIFATIIVLSIYPFAIDAKNKMYMKNFKAFLIYLIPVAILMVQSAWLLPDMNEQSELVMKGVQVPDANIKYYYLIAEAAKLISLFSLGIIQIV